MTKSELIKDDLRQCGEYRLGKGSEEEEQTANYPLLCKGVLLPPPLPPLAKLIIFKLRSF